MKALAPGALLIAVSSLACATTARPARAVDAPSSGAVPRCWQADRAPGDEPIEEGAFRVLIPTEGRSAQDAAQALFELQGAMAEQKGVGTTSTLETIEVDLQATALGNWHKSLAYPTLGSLKQAIVESLEPVIKAGARVECVKTQARRPRH